MYLHTKNRYIVVKVQDLKYFLTKSYTSTIERAIIIKIQIDKTTIANGKQNNPITIAIMITIEANGMNKIELYMKATTKQIAYKMTNAQPIKKSVIFLIFPFYVLLKKNTTNHKNTVDKYAIKYSCGKYKYNSIEVIK